MRTTIQSIEKYIDMVLGQKLHGLANAPETEKNLKYAEDLKKANYFDFISSGDYAYFTSRIIFLQGLGVIAFLLAHQAIENYLKAYIKFKGGDIKQMHDLMYLLGECRHFADGKSFLHSTRANLIASRYNPFYELPRYPVQKTRPKDGRYGFVVPDDIYWLDYFIYKLRNEMPIPDGTWDTFKNGHPWGTTLFSGEGESEKVITLFKLENINFS